MGQKKRVILLGENESAPKSIFENLTALYTDSYMDPYEDCESFFKDVHRKKHSHTDSDDEALIIINSPNKSGDIQKSINELINCTDFMFIPIVVLLHDPDVAFSSNFYRDKVSCVVLISKDIEKLIINLTAVFDFWLVHVKLPKKIKTNTIDQKLNISKALGN